MAGFLRARRGRLLAPDQVIGDRDLRFEVQVMDGRRITQVVVVRQFPADAASHTDHG